jgi:uncharacterized lipoprotein NlpE involved in copper resistance
MKKIVALFGISIFTLAVVSCTKKDKEVKPVFIQEEVLDTIFNSKFEALIPCPDCPGIETTLRFYSDSTIVRTTYYEDKNQLPETRTGTWKRQDSIFIATFDKDKLFYKIKSGSKILRVGSDFKEVEGDLAAGYTFKRVINFDKDNILGKYIVGDTLSDFKEIQIFKTNKDVYSINFIGAQKTDSTRYCQYQLKGKFNTLDELIVDLNKVSDTLKGELRLMFTKNEVHALYDKISRDSLPNFCKKQVFIPIEGSYKKIVQP